MEPNRDHSVIFEIASLYCISDSFVDHDGHSISSEGFLAGDKLDRELLNSIMSVQAAPSRLRNSKVVCPEFCIKSNVRKRN